MSYPELEELEAEFAGLEALIDGASSPVDVDQAVDEVVRHLQEAHAIVRRLSGMSQAEGDPPAQEAVEGRLIELEENLAAVSAQLDDTRRELSAIRQLLSET